MINGPETFIPVYFTHWNPKLQEILDGINEESVPENNAGSAFETLLNSVSASGYQVVVSPGQISPQSNAKIATLQGKLSGISSENKLPTIVIVAHYDSFGAASVRFH